MQTPSDIPNESICPRLFKELSDRLLNHEFVYLRITDNPTSNKLVLSNNISNSSDLINLLQHREETSI